MSELHSWVMSSSPQLSLLWGLGREKEKARGRRREVIRVIVVCFFPPGSEEGR